MINKFIVTIALLSCIQSSHILTMEKEIKYAIPLIRIDFECSGEQSIGKIPIQEQLSSSLPSPDPHYQVLADIATSELPIQQTYVDSFNQLLTNTELLKKDATMAIVMEEARKILLKSKIRMRYALSFKLAKQQDISTQLEKSHYLWPVKTHLSQVEEFGTDRSRYARWKETKARLEKLENMEKELNEKLTTEKDTILRSYNEHLSTRGACSIQPDEYHLLENDNHVLLEPGEFKNEIQLLNKLLPHKRNSKYILNSLCTLALSQKILATSLKEFEERIAQHVKNKKQNLQKNQDNTQLKQAQTEWHSAMRDLKLVKGSYSTMDAMQWKIWGIVTPETLD